jgi:hypothetical protein
VQKVPITFILEPWGEEYTMEPHVNWTLVLRSTVPPVGSNGIEVTYDIDCITVYGWEGCTVTLFQNGEEMPKDLTGERPCVPKVPGQ